MFKKSKLFVFDLDGTVWQGEHLLPHAKETIENFRKEGQVVFFSNTSSKRWYFIYEKLINFQISCAANEIYVVTDYIREYLLEQNINNVYVIGSNDLFASLAEKGIIINNTEKADHLVVGLDVNLTYDKLEKASQILLKGGRFIVGNRDRNFPSKEGILKPGCGAIVTALSCIADAEVNFMVGKPNPYILNKIANTFQCQAEEIVIIGDSHESDIRMAQAYGSKFIRLGSQSFQFKNGIEVKDLKEAWNEFTRIRNDRNS
jgi:HAD superfamily hydrolase (TIGR01450 family)